MSAIAAAATPMTLSTSDQLNQYKQLARAQHANNVFFEQQYMDASVEAKARYNNSEPSTLERFEAMAGDEAVIDKFAEVKVEVTPDRWSKFMFAMYAFLERGDGLGYKLLEHSVTPCIAVELVAHGKGRHDELKEVFSKNISALHALNASLYVADFAKQRHAAVQNLVINNYKPSSSSASGASGKPLMPTVSTWVPEDMRLNRATPRATSSSSSAAAAAAAAASPAHGAAAAAAPAAGAAAADGNGEAAPRKGVAMADASRLLSKCPLYVPYDTNNLRHCAEAGCAVTRDKTEAKQRDKLTANTAVFDEFGLLKCNCKVHNKAPAGGSKCVHCNGADFDDEFTLREGKTATPLCAACQTLPGVAKQLADAAAGAANGSAPAAAPAKGRKRKTPSEGAPRKRTTPKTDEPAAAAADADSGEAAAAAAAPVAAVVAAKPKPPKATGKPKAAAAASSQDESAAAAAAAASPTPAKPPKASGKAKASSAKPAASPAAPVASPAPTAVASFVAVNDDLMQLDEEQDALSAFV